MTAERRKQAARRSSSRLVLSALLALAAARASADQSVDRLRRALSHPGLRGAAVGTLVVRAADGMVLFERDAERPLVPASNLKLLTAVAALQAFGPAHRFTTPVLADTLPDADGAVGTLAVRGGGDPALTSEEWWRLAADLRARGLRRVRGDLLLDDSYFDQQRWHPSWGGVSARAFHAPVGALSANYGSFAVEIVPAGPGASPRVNIDPPVPYFQLLDQTGSGKGGALAVERDTAGVRDRVTVSGRVPNGAPTTIFRSVSDPVRYAAAVLRMQLAAQGIIVDGQDRVAPVPAGFHELLAFEGKPLAEIVRLFMKFSNNNVAEMLVKDLGAHDAGPPGTWETGVTAVRRQLAALGVDTTGLVMVDGSGLSPDDRVAPRTLVSALRTARASFTFGPELLAALPLAARDGTLSKRAAAAADRVRAKTGLLAGAASLSGLARTREGTDVVFSILVNGYDRGDAEVRDAIDGFAAALVQ